MARVYERQALGQVEPLLGNAFMAEAGADTFRITDLPFEPTNVLAHVLRADDTAIAVDGTLDDDGAAVVTLHADCYHVPGRLQVAIYITDGDGVSQCVYACVGNVHRTIGGTELDSGAEIPTLAQLEAAYQACVTATADARAAADNAVIYSAAQTLTAAEQAQARGNISAAEADDFDAVAYPRGVEMLTSSDSPINIIAGGLSTSGGDTSNTARARTQYFRVQPGHRYLFELDDAEFGVLSAFEYKGTTMGSVIGRLDAEYFPNKRVAFTASGNFVRISFAHVDRTTTVTEEDRALILAAISLRETASDNLAPVDNPTAAVTHTAGSLLTVSGQLYKATQAIAPGDAIAAGTNVTATSVAEQLAALEARIAALEG